MPALKPSSSGHLDRFRMLYLLRPIFILCTCEFPDLLFDYLSVLSRFCFKCHIFCLNIRSCITVEFVFVHFSILAFYRGLTLKHLTSFELIYRNVNDGYCNFPFWIPKRLEVLFKWIHHFKIGLNQQYGPSTHLEY